MCGVLYEPRRRKMEFLCESVRARQGKTWHSESEKLQHRNLSGRRFIRYFSVLTLLRLCRSSECENLPWKSTSLDGTGTSLSTSTHN